MHRTSGTRGGHSRCRRLAARQVPAIRTRLRVGCFLQSFAMIGALMNIRRLGGFSILILLCSLFTASSSVAGEAVRLKGSGASFPFPLYGQWFKEYGKAHRGVIIDYQAKGSGAGIRDFINKTVDFAASDAAMTDEEMKQVDLGVQLLPMTAGSIVLSYNLPGGPQE